MYTSAKYAMALCMFTSVTSQSSVERLNESRLFFAWKLPSAYIVHGIVREFVYLQNKGTSFCNFALNSGLGKFRYGKLIVLSTNTVKLVDFFTIDTRSLLHVGRLSPSVNSMTSISAGFVTQLFPTVVQQLTRF